MLVKNQSHMRQQRYEALPKLRNNCMIDIASLKTHQYHAKNVEKMILNLLGRWIAIEDGFYQGKEE